MEEKKESKTVRDARGAARRMARNGGGSYQKCLDVVARDVGHLHWKAFMAANPPEPSGATTQGETAQHEAPHQRRGPPPFRPVPYEQWRDRLEVLTRNEFAAHEARVCISEGEILANPRRVRRFTREQYFKTSAQMQALFADLPSALDNAVEIAKRCSLTLKLGKPQLPDYPTPDIDGRRMPIEDYFRYASHEGLKERLLHLYPDEAERERERPRAVKL